MQNSNANQYGNSNQPPKGKLPWLSKNRWLPVGGLALILVVYLLCSDPDTPTIDGRQLSFNPANGTVVEDSLGNKDAHVNPGEQVKIRIRLANTGDKPIPPFNLVLATKDTAVKLIDNRLQFKKGIGSKDTVLSDDFFEFKLNETFLFDCLRFTSRIERLALAGMVGTAFATNGANGINGDPPIDIYTYPNYRVCMGPCTLEVGPAATNLAELTIDAAICNDGFTNLSTLTNARVKIVSVKLCVSAVTFSPMSSGGAFLDNFDYGNVGINNCAPPSVPTNRFKFRATTSYLPQPSETMVCIYFYVEIYRNLVDKIGERNLGIRAQVVRRTNSSNIVAAGMRPGN